MNNRLIAAETESTVLSTLLVFPEHRPVYLSKLKPALFGAPGPQAAYKVFCELYEINPDFDTLAFDDILRKREKRPEIVHEVISSRQATGTNLDYHIAKLQEYAYRREIVQKATRLHRAASENGGELSEVHELIESLNHAGAETLSIPGLTPYQIEERDRKKPKFDKLKMGHPLFDDALYKYGGSHKGTTEVIYGLPKHGKSHYAIWKTKNYIEQGYKCLYVTLENTDSSISRLVRNHLGDTHENLRNLIIADRSAGCSELTEVVNAIRYWNAKIDLDVFVIDYLQRLPVRGTGPKDEVQRVTAASNRLTDLAVETQTFGMILAQPHRLEKHRTGWKAEPEVEDLYGASAIEKDAYSATVVFRPNRTANLRIENDQGELVAVKSFDGTEVHKNSVYIRQKLIREGELDTTYFRFIHTNVGLQMRDEVDMEKTKDWTAGQPEPIEDSPF